MIADAGKEGETLELGWKREEGRHLGKMSVWMLRRGRTREKVLKWRRRPGCLRDRTGFKGNREGLRGRGKYRRIGSVYGIAETQQGPLCFLSYLDFTSDVYMVGTTIPSFTNEERKAQTSKWHDCEWQGKIQPQLMLDSE
jgi:hypothetical protein